MREKLLLVTIVAALAALYVSPNFVERGSNRNTAASLVVPLPDPCKPPCAR